MRLLIKEIREKIGFSQSELSDKSGVSRATIWALESGNAKVTTTKTLKKIADAMNVTPNELFTDDQAS